MQNAECKMQNAKWGYFSNSHLGNENKGGTTE
jgi:hypothetical protein